MPERSLPYLLLTLLILSLLLLPQNLIAETGVRIILDRGVDSYDLSDHMEILEDPQQLLDISAVTTGRQQLEFTPFHGSSPNFGNTQSAFWLRTQLVNPYPYEVHVVLEQPLPFLDSIDLYTPDPSRPGEFRVSHAGDRRPFAEREVPHHHFLFNLTLQPAETLPLHIRIASRVTLMAPFTFWLKPAWDEHAGNLALTYGVFFGILLVLFVMALLLTLFLRDPVYPLFALLVFSIALMTATTQGLSYKYLWPASPWLGERMQVASILFVMLAGTLFARIFLATKEHLPRLDRLLTCFMALLVVLVTLSFSVTEVKPVAVFSFSLIQLYSPLLLFSGYLSRREGVPAARFYLIAWTLSLIGSTIASLTMLGVVPYHFTLLHATSIGFILDSILLALAMSDRINAIRVERDQARKNAHDTLEKARRNLESEVDRRTRELVIAKQEADSANRAKTQFLANMSHELRTPLTSIIGFSELLLNESKGPLREVQRRNLKIIHRSGVHLGSLIDDVLDVSIIETGKLNVNMEPISFRTILDEVLAIVSTMAGGKAINVADTTIEQQPFVVMADRVRLRQVVTNLLSNAIKYSPERSDIRVSLKSRNDRIRLSVIDNGPGIAPADLERIFTPFTRLEEMADKVEGIGIGLSITKMLVGLMGGEIHVESRLGRGTSFHVDLAETARTPLRAEEKSFEADLDRLDAEPPERPLVLYIEDSPSNRVLLETLFRNRTDLELICAEDGEQGLQLAQERSPSIILTDLRMPGLDGFAVLKELRAQRMTRDIPVIAVSSHEQDKVPLGKEGFVDFLSKPLNVRTLMDRIDGLLFRAESRVEESEVES